MFSPGSAMGRQCTLQEQISRLRAYTAAYIATCIAAALILLWIAGSANAADWQLRIRNAAVVQGERVLLGEIADPVGPIHPDLWKKLAKTPLWPSPKKSRRPMSISRPKLQKVIRQYLGDGADTTILPASLVLQRGGKVLLEPDLRTRIVETLTPRLALLAGEGSVREMKLPRHMFMRSRHNTLRVQLPKELSPGRVPVYLHEVSPDNKIERRISCGLFLDVWVTVPCVASPVNRFDALTPANITHELKNMAYLRGSAWNGKGGPWRLLRAIGTGGVIYQTDLERLPMLAKGHTVSLIYKSNSLQLTTVAEALADGKPGDTIPVRNLQSHRQVFATVQDADTVIITRK